MIIARIESLILGKSVNDAIMRAEKYVDAGTDRIMIHSKDKDPKEIFKFAEKFKKFLKTFHLLLFPQVIILLKKNNWRRLVLI